MAAGPPKQLTDGDAVFLSMETAASSGHVGALLVLDPGSREGSAFETLRAHIVSRLSLVPRFGWKLQSVPLGLDRPYWVEDPDFDPAAHVIHTAVPAPGSLKQVTALAARLHAQPLDRRRPLWQAWCIEGLENGRVALYLKTHHCLVDGTGGAGLAEVLADLTPDATAPSLVPAAFDESAPAPPTGATVLARGLGNAFRRRGRVLSHVGRGLREIAGSWNEDSATTGRVERLGFNRNIGKDRAIATASIDFERVRDLKKHLDVTVNDVVLEVVGSAMRRWLRDRSETPERALVAMCPVSTRGDAVGMGNEITSMAVSLATDLADPIERLRAIHESSERAKRGVSNGSFDWIAALGETVPPGVAQLLMMASELAGDSGPLPANFVVSNVRGTPMPLYLGGARLESMMPLSMLATGQGLNVTVVSYCDRLDFGILVDPALVPDPWELAACLPAALDEIETAAQGVVHRAA